VAGGAVVANDRGRFPEKRQNPSPPGSSGYTQDTVVLNDFSGVTFEQRTRTSATGKTGVRYSLSIEAEPILHNLDGVYLGAKPAQAIRDLLEKQTRDIGEFIKPATKKAREKLKKAYAAGKDYAVKRYTGGRMGEKKPGDAGTDRIGLDSGRLAKGWHVMQNPVEQSFTINVPQNRFTPETWGGTMASLQQWVTRFVSLVPALADPKSILADDSFVRAVATSKPVEVITGARMRIWKAYAGVAASAWRQGRGLLAL
jgi:hypothetical protein